MLRLGEMLISCSPPLHLTSNTDNVTFLLKRCSLSFLGAIDGLLVVSRLFGRLNYYC